MCDSDDKYPKDNPDDTDGDKVCDSGDNVRWIRRMMWSINQYADACPRDRKNDADGDKLCANVDSGPADRLNGVGSDRMCGGKDTRPLTLKTIVPAIPFVTLQIFVRPRHSMLSILLTSVTMWTRALLLLK